MRRTHSAALALAAALLVPSLLPSAASPPLAQKAQKESLKIYRSALVNGVLLDAGTYRVELAPSLDALTFVKGKSALVTVPCRVGMVAIPVTGDTVHYRPREDGREEITRIVFAGRGLSIELGAEVEGPPIASAPKP